VGKWPSATRPACKLTCKPSFHPRAKEVCTGTAARVDWRWWAKVKEMGLMDQCTGPGPNSAPFVYFLYFLTTMIAILHGVQVFIQEGRPLEQKKMMLNILSQSLSRYLLSEKNTV
jgi:hypothetical protein